MDISSAEQRILHLLAQGGHIQAVKSNKRVIHVDCYTRDGWKYPAFGVELFRKLKRRKTIKSLNGGPYRITKRGLMLVRSQLNNR